MNFMFVWQKINFVCFGEKGGGGINKWISYLQFNIICTCSTFYSFEYNKKIYIKYESFDTDLQTNCCSFSFVDICLLFVFENDHRIIWNNNQLTFKIHKISRCGKLLIARASNGEYINKINNPSNLCGLPSHRYD